MISPRSAFFWFGQHFVLRCCFSETPWFLCWNWFFLSGVIANLVYFLTSHCQKSGLTLEPGTFPTWLLESRDGKSKADCLFILYFWFFSCFRRMVSGFAMDCSISGRFAKYISPTRCFSFLIALAMKTFPIPQKGSGVCSDDSRLFLVSSPAVSLPSYPIWSGIQSIQTLSCEPT